MCDPFTFCAALNGSCTCQRQRRNEPCETLKMAFSHWEDLQVRNASILDLEKARHKINRSHNTFFRMPGDAALLIAKNLNPRDYCPTRSEHY